MLRKILYLSISLILPLCIVEYYARQHFDQYSDAQHYLQKLASERLLNSLIIPSTDHTQSKRFGYALPPNATETITHPEYTYTITTNSAGFRTRELREHQPGEHRTLLFGDSMLFGVGLAEQHTLAAQLEKLGAAQSQSSSVYNYSMLSFNTVQALIAARTYAPQADPDHLLLGIFVANDLLDNALSYADAQGNLAYDTARITALQTELSERLSPLMPSIALRAWALNIWLPRLRYQMASEPRFMQHTYHLIDDFARLAAELDARASVVVIYPRYASAGDLMGMWSASRKPGALLAQYCRNNNIAVLDLLDHIQGGADAARYYYKQDGHFNAEGNRHVAALIHQHLIINQ
jgi:hypothetical protein